MGDLEGRGRPCAQQRRSHGSGYEGEDVRVVSTRIHRTKSGRDRLYEQHAMTVLLADISLSELGRVLRVGRSHAAEVAPPILEEPGFDASLLVRSQ